MVGSVLILQAAHITVCCLILGQALCSFLPSCSTKVPLTDYMRQYAEQQGGAGLVGSLLWQYRFDQLTQAGAPAGAWVPATVLDYDNSAGEHEVRTEGLGTVWYARPATACLVALACGGAQHTSLN